jgi:DNA-binding GntR family transcriptional regulator
MRISTRGRYALRLMLDLATNYTGKPIRLKDVAKRQGISDKYLEQIISIIETAVLMFANLTHRRLRQETIITHRAITKSIAEHDPVGARSAMTMHISYNRAAIKEIYDARNRELENQEQ